MSSQVVEFYKGLKPDSEGRILYDIHKWNVEMLESTHDYIQWLFPLTVPSLYNPKAPILIPEDLIEFQTSKTIRSNLIASFDLLISFYGFKSEENNSQIVLIKSDLFRERSKIWLKKDNHNFLRLTRIIKCLNLARLNNYAQALFDILEELYNREYKNVIGRESFNYWKAAICT